VDVRYINPFLSGTVEVLSTMAHVQLIPGKPFIKSGQTAMGDVTGLVGLTGEVRGSLSVTFVFRVIQATMKGMLGDEITEIDNTVRDAVGELTNMISGTARRYLAEEGLSLRAGIPTVVSGKGHVIQHITNSPILAIPFQSQFGRVLVEVSIEG